MVDILPPVQIRFWFKRGLRAAAVDESDIRSSVLADFVESDVQASCDAAREWLDRLARVKGGGVKSDKGTGNAFTVTINPDVVTLQNAIFPDDSLQCYSHDEFQSTLKRVLAALDTGSARNDQIMHEDG